MKRNEFRIKEYRGKFYIERKLVSNELIADKVVKLLWCIKFSYTYSETEVVTWERVDDYGNHVKQPNGDFSNWEQIRDLRRYLERRLPYFKTLAKANKKIEEFFQEPKYHYLK